MAASQFNWENFHDASTADFHPCERPSRDPDFVSGSGSRYWNTPEGVIRESDHWLAGIRSCNWYLDGATYKGPERCGFCRWEDFQADRRQCQAWRSERLAWLRELRPIQHTKRTSRQAAVVGNAVRATRTVTERVSGRRYQTITEVVRFTIKKITANFFVADDGRRFAIHTLTNLEAA